MASRLGVGLGLLFAGVSACSSGAAPDPSGTPPPAGPVALGSGEAGITLPSLASEPVEVRAGSLRIEFALVGTPPVRLERRASGFFADAGERRIEYRTVPGGIEDWVYLAKPPPTPLRYRLALDGVAGLRQVAHVLEMLDAKGTPVLRAGPAYLVDATGVRRDVGLALSGCNADESPLAPWGRPVTPPGASECELELRFDDTGLVYPIAVDPPWTASAGNLAVARSSPEAVRLSDGRVLVIAGSLSSTAELYDPATRSWATTGPMSVGRPGAAAALLPNGKVLVTGGTTLPSAEVYDPATGKFSATGDMKVARSDHSATTLANGKVLIAGGHTPAESTACDLYDPASGTFASTGPLATPRADHTATLLNDGRVLLVGTWGAAASEIYSPTTGNWTAAPGLGSLEDHSATLLGDGRVLVVGGRTGGGLSTTDQVMVFNPTGSSWAALATLPGPITKRRSHGAVRLPDGRVVVVGGSCDYDCAVLQSYYEHGDGAFFGPTGGSWTKTSAPMSKPRTAPGVVLLSSGNVLVLGPDTSSEELCLSQGCACNVAGECSTGFCVDGVCCDSSCTGTCRACTKALKNQGVDGTCGDIAAENDPQSECTASPAASCGLDGMCDGKGACRKHVSGTACAPSSCIDATSEVHADSCDGNGTCVKNGSGPCKAGYVCKNDACTTACGDKTDCAPGYECLGGSCSLRPNGTPCTDAGQCQSGQCVEGVCCDAACDGQCEACTEPGKVGTCSPISGDPSVKGKPACGTGEGPCGSTCNGADPKKCVYPGEETKCSEPGKVCDGAGKCVLSGAQCSTDGSESVATDGTKTACGAYRCDPSSGECRDVCSFASDCQLGHYCQGKKCLKKTNAAASDDGGCSVSGAPGRSGGSALGLALLGGALLFRRRRAVAVAAGLAVLGSVGCSSSGAGDDAKEASAPTLESHAGSPVLDALRSRFGARVLKPGLATKFVQVDGHVLPHLPAEAATREGAARVRLPLTADQPFSLEDVATGLSAEVGLDGATRTPLTLSDGLALYPAAASGGDVVLRAGLFGVEDFVSFPRRPAAPRLAYRVTLHGVAGLRLVANHLELLDKGGAPRLTVEPPYVVDARGDRHPASLGVEGCAVDLSPVAPFDRPVTPPGASSCRVVVSWADHLDYPLLVDPSWATTPGQGGVTNHATSVLNTGNVLLAHAGSSWVWNGTWAASGAMQAWRTNATATTLSDGRVLVVGGGSASAELYNPTTGTWTATGSMAASRSGHRAVLLSDGSVLVTGGDATGTAERWVNGTFSSAGSLGKVRQGHTATLLADGRVIVVGGVNGASNDKSTRIYSLTGGWVAGPNTLELRQNHVAARLADGRVLVAGGEDVLNGPGAIANVELLNAAGTAFSAGTSMLGPSRSAVAVPFGLGAKVYVIGGRGSGAGAGGASSIFDAAGGGWVDGGALNRTRIQHTAELRPNGQILVVGGFTGAETLPPSEVQCVDFGCACSATTPCLVGSCVDGFCCKTACTGACQACSAALKVSGPNGECGPIADGSDPDNECATQPASTCGTLGSCNGAGACRLYAAGTDCAAASCAQPTVSQPSSTCDGNGACVAPAPVSCGTGYACVGTACKTSCTSASDCASGFTCKSGECKKKANGESCADGGECTSGFCVDTVCCDQDCTGQCEACNQTGTPGLCVPVSGAPVGSRPACGGTAPCAGTCSGTNPDACTFPTASCGEGKTCSNGECIQTTAVCVDDDTASQSSSGTKTPCNPYRCDPATGTCRSSCTKASECTLGSVCDQGQCKSGSGSGGSGGGDAGLGGSGGSAGGKGAPAGDEGGCGCRAAGSERERRGSAALAALVLALVVLRRRERRRSP